MSDTGRVPVPQETTHEVRKDTENVTDNPTQLFDQS